MCGTDALVGLPTLGRKAQALVESAQHNGAVAALEMFELVARKAESLDTPQLLSLLGVGTPSDPNAHSRIRKRCRRVTLLPRAQRVAVLRR